MTNPLPMNRLIIACVVTLLFSGVSFAQTENSAFTLTGHGQGTTFSTDYQALGINPANIDIPSYYQGRRVALGFSEFGVSVYSGMLSKQDVRKNIFGGEFRDLSRQEKMDMAIEFAQHNNSADIDVMLTGFSFQTERFGSFAFSVRDRVDYYSKLGPRASELLWLGNSSSYFTQYILSSGDTIDAYPNISEDSLAMIIEGLNLDKPMKLSELVNGSSFRFSWVREFSLGYSKRLLKTENMEVYAGVSGKFLMGQGYMYLNADNDGARAFSSLSPIFGIEYGEIAEQNPSAIPSDGSKLKPVGIGFGVDFGATVIFKEKMYFSASVTDIGSMTWDGNVYALKDVNLTNYVSAGLENLQLVEQIEALNGADGLVEWQGASSVTTKLPAMMRFGAGLRWNEKIKGGIDVVQSLNDEVGALEKANIAVGAEFTPVRWLHLSAGYMTGGNYDMKIPAGITFSFRDGGYEFGFASRDLITFFTNNQPTVSMAAGFFRFRI